MQIGKKKVKMSLFDSMGCQHKQSLKKMLLTTYILARLQRAYKSNVYKNQLNFYKKVTVKSYIQVKKCHLQ